MGHVAWGGLRHSKTPWGLARGGEAWPWTGWRLAQWRIIRELVLTERTRGKLKVSLKNQVYIWVSGKINGGKACLQKHCLAKDLLGSRKACVCMVLGCNIWWERVLRVERKKEEAQGKSEGRRRPLGGPVCSLGLCVPSDGESHAVLLLHLPGLQVLI